jgi:hypothetical protein
MHDLAGEVLTVDKAKAIISENPETIAGLTTKITEMQEIVNKKYGGWCDNGVKELREDAKKYFNDIETLGKGNILRDLEHQIETDTTLIEFLQKELDHVSKELKDLKRRNGFLDF